MNLKITVLIIAGMTLLIGCASRETKYTEPPIKEDLTIPDSEPTISPPKSEWDTSSLLEINAQSASDIEELFVLHGGNAPIPTLAFNPSGSLLASGDIDGDVRFWDMNSGDEIAAIKQGRQTMEITFNPDGTILASGDSDGAVRLWDMAGFQELGKFDGHVWGIFDVDFSPDGKLIASGSVDQSIQMWEVPDGTEKFVLHGHQEDVYALDFSPDGTILASGSEDKSVRLWDLASGEQIHQLSAHQEPVNDVHFSPDGSFLATCGGGITGADNSIRIWDTVDWELLLALEGQSEPMSGCMFNNDGGLLFTRSIEPTLNVWEMPSGVLIKSLSAFPTFAPSMALSPDGKLLALGDPEGRIHVYGVRQ
jgi:WD40 repeat protein